MKIKYFEAAATALVGFGGGTGVETRGLSEDVYLDLDNAGHVVSLPLFPSHLP
ncbi:MAG: DUF2283 domain-containing protein [Opitutales bacterium]|nr:DUF2283 domain-containing protein [Opitutales bacterium]